MNAVLGLTRLVLDSRLDPQQREYLETACCSAESLLGLLNDILDLSKIEAGRMALDNQPFSPRQCVREAAATIDPLAGRKGLRLAIDIGKTVPETVSGDSMRLRQVLLNLLGNAIKFTHEGEIRVALEVESADPQSVMLRLTVADTGIGIPLEKQSLVFEAFRQADGCAARKYGGTGLGLTICSRLADLMGGRVWVDSAPGCGSTFHFTARFGLLEAPVADGGTKAAPAVDVKERPLRVLLAEDNPVNQKVASELLRRRGHTVTVVGNGEEAVDAVRGEAFDVVLMDVQMPVMDGFEATAAIRRDGNGGRRLPIVALTAHAMKGDREKCMAAGMDGYLCKPIQPADLFRCLAEAAG